MSLPRGTELGILFSKWTAKTGIFALGLQMEGVFLPTILMLCGGENLETQKMSVAPAPGTENLWGSSLLSGGWDNAICLIQDVVKDQTWLILLCSTSNTKHMITDHTGLALMYLHTVCIHYQDFSIHQVNCISSKPQNILKEKENAVLPFLLPSRHDLWLISFLFLRLNLTTENKDFLSTEKTGQVFFFKEIPHLSYAQGFFFSSS